MDVLSDGVYRLRRPSKSALSALASDQASRPLPYGPVGMSLGHGSPPANFDHLQVTRDAGQGADRFAVARSAIIDWAGHRTAGAVLEPAVPELAEGAVVALALRVWPLWVTATCRVVQVVDEPGRFGFAYGTLPHHAAVGEESFLVTMHPETGDVRFEVNAYSRPATLLATLGGPIGRRFQRYMANRYLDGFVGFGSAEPR